MCAGSWETNPLGLGLIACTLTPRSWPSVELASNFCSSMSLPDRSLWARRTHCMLPLRSRNSSTVSACTRHRSEPAQVNRSQCRSNCMRARHAAERGMMRRAVVARGRAAPCTRCATWLGGFPGGLAAPPAWHMHQVRWRQSTHTGAAAAASIRARAHHDDPAAVCILGGLRQLVQHRACGAPAGSHQLEHGI